MITPEDFAELAKSIEAGEPVSNEKAKEILTTIYEMDANLVILQNCLELAVDNARNIIPAVAEKVLSMSGRTDGKSKKKAASYAAEVTARFEVALQMYLAGAAEKAQEMLYGENTESIDEDTETNPIPEETTNEESK